MLACFCKECGKKMKKVLHFESNKGTTFYLCQDCNYKTKPKQIIFADNEEKGGRS